METDNQELVYTEETTQNLPGFIKGWAITAIVFSSLRILAIPLSVFGYFSMDQGDPLKITVIPEIIFHLVLLAFGLAANIAILIKKPIGYTLGKLYVAAILLSFCLAIVQTVITVQQTAQQNAAQALGAIIGASIAFFARIVLVSFYGIAVKKYGQFIAVKTGE